jgi:hypothetical protein
MNGGTTHTRARATKHKARAAAATAAVVVSRTKGGRVWFDWIHPFLFVCTQSRGLMSVKSVHTAGAGRCAFARKRREGEGERGRCGGVSPPRHKKRGRGGHMYIHARFTQRHTKNVQGCSSGERERAWFSAKKLAHATARAGCVKMRKPTKGA